MGRSVPEKMSLINLGNSPLMQFALPPVTCVDVDFASQVRLAMERLVQFRNGEGKPGELILQTPHLIERASVSNVK